MAQNDVYLAQYFTSQVVKDRNKVGLVNWAGYISTIPIPTDPSDDWIRLRVAAEQVPIQADNVTNQTLAFFVQDPATKTNINTLLSGYNTEAQETSISAAVEGVINAFMPRFALTYITKEQVDAWRKQNGYELPPVTLTSDERNAFEVKQREMRAAKVKAEAEIKELLAERAKAVLAEAQRQLQQAA